MAFFDVWESNQLRRSARLAFNDAAEPDEMETGSKRQKTSTIEGEDDMNSTRSDTAYTSLLDEEHQANMTEVTLIKQEDEIRTEGIVILDEFQDVETVQPSNNTETLSNHTGTLSTMEALELAEKCIDDYAGPDTRTLEDMRKNFKGLSSPHHKHCLAVSAHVNTLTAGKIHSNKHCLRCLGTNANVKCRSCPRVYHRACLPDEQAESIQAMLAREQSPDLGEEHQVSIYCPLCYKRLFSCLRLQSDLTPAAREQRILIIAHQLKRLPERVEWMKLHDDGSLLSDRRLLEDLGQNFRTWSARYRP
jgi:hypothetical protein